MFQTKIFFYLTGPRFPFFLICGTLGAKILKRYCSFKLFSNYSKRLIFFSMVTFSIFVKIWFPNVKKNIPGFSYMENAPL